MRYLYLMISIFISLNLSAQKKISFDLNVSVLQSASEDVLKTFVSDKNPLTIQYYSRKKFKHPYFNLLGNINYHVNQKIAFGIASGFYLHYLEKYFSNIERTTISFPLMATFRYKLIDIKVNQLGIDLAAGNNFFYIDEGVEKIKNGTILNASVFYIIHKRNIIKIGVEKEIDNVSFYFIADGQGYQNETFKYHVNRLSVKLSYGFQL